MSDSRFVSLYWSDPSFRDRLLAGRRRKYQEDKEFREAQLHRVKKGRAKKTGSKKRGTNLPRVFEVDGFPILMIGLAQAAQRVGLSKKALRVLDDLGVIPRNRLFDGLGRRWYPTDFIEWLAPFLEQQSKKREPHWLLKERVERVWETSPVTKIGDRREAQ